jgi:hypothetical protein
MIVDRPFSRGLRKTRRQHHSFGHHWGFSRSLASIFAGTQSPFQYLPAEGIGIALVTDKPIAGTRRSPDPFDDQEIGIIARAARVKTYALVTVGVMLAVAVAYALRGLIHTSTIIVWSKACGRRRPVRSACGTGDARELFHIDRL